MSTYTCPERARSSSKRSTGAKGLKDIIQDLLYLLPRKKCDMAMDHDTGSVRALFA
jgi:hypothetical protein